MSIISQLSQSQAEISELIIDKEKIDENLFCGICSELVLEPKECNDCQHLFHLDCINDWSKKSNICPFCRKAPMNLKEPHRFVKNMISSLKVQCPNITTGCKQAVAFQSLNNHIQECQYQVIHCEFAGCQESLLRSQLKQHQENCNFRIIICLKCQCPIKFKESQQHDCIQKLYEIIQNQNEKLSQLTQIIEVNKQESMKQIQWLTDKLNKLELDKHLKQYYCPQQHTLSWSQGSMGTKCFQCKNSDGIVRYKCNLCQIQYCQMCKPPIFVNGCCQLQHKLKFQEKAGKNIICDFCNTSPSQLNISNWNDQICDFDVCANCYKKFQS